MGVLFEIIRDETYNRIKQVEESLNFAHAMGVFIECGSVARTPWRSLTRKKEEEGGGMVTA